MIFYGNNRLKIIEMLCPREAENISEKAENVTSSSIEIFYQGK